MPVEYWFPTPVFVRDLEGDELQTVQAEIEQVLPQIRSRSTPAITGGAMLTTFFWGNGNAHDIAKYNLINLKQAIRRAVDDYTVAINLSLIHI